MDEQQPKPEGGDVERERDFYRPGGQEAGGSGDVSKFEGYGMDDERVPRPAVHDVMEPVSWEASEYIHHDKGFMWVLGLIGCAVAMVALAVWLQAWTFAALIVVMAVALGVFAFRRPHVLRYTLDGEGIRVGEKFYGFEQFRAFGILGDGAFYTIMLLPTKRFAPAINVYFDEADGEKIVDILGERLPMEKVELDLVERLTRRLRF